MPDQPKEPTPPEQPNQGAPEGPAPDSERREIKLHAPTAPAGGQGGGETAEGSVSKFLPKTELRPDGLYLSVRRDEREGIDIEKLKQTIQNARIMNADINRIVDVIGRARGVPERIGDPFEFYDPRKDGFIELAVSPLEVKVTISSMSIADGVEISHKDVLYRMDQQGIVFGVDANAIKDMLEGKVYDAPTVVAEAKPAEDGLDGKMEERVKIDPNAKPPVRSDGKVDFKNVEIFKQISEGTVIAVRYPPTEGKPGTDIFGKPIEPAPGKDIKLPIGKNTRITEDGNELLADCGGYLYRKDKMICVGEVLTLRKDVDFSTGNVKYRGAVIVKGDIKPGFKVESESDVVIHGNVDGADVLSRKGSVVIKNGVFGHDRSRIFARKEIQVLFAQNAIIETESTLSTTKYLMHCKSRAREIAVTSASGNIVGGVAIASDRIRVQDAGNDQGIETILRIIDPQKESIGQKIRELGILESRMATALLPLQKRLKSMNTMIRKTEAIGERSRAELKKAMDEYLGLSKKLEYVRKKKEEAEKALQEPSELLGEIHVVGKAYSAVTMELYGYKRELKGIEQRQRYWAAGEQVQSQSLTGAQEEEENEEEEKPDAEA